MMLLHVASRTTTVTRLDSVVLALGIVALAVLTVVIAGVLWRRELRRTAHRATRGRAARTALSLALLVAVCSSTIPVDHWFMGAGATQTEAAAHEEHCHGNAASCSDAPVAAGTAFFVGTEPLMVVPPLLAVLLVFALPVLRGTASKPDVPPPLRLSLAPIH